MPPNPPTSLYPFIFKTHPPPPTKNPGYVPEYQMGGLRNGTFYFRRGDFIDQENKLNSFLNFSQSLYANCLRFLRSSIL